jgi:hypothetical protein
MNMIPRLDRGIQKELDTPIKSEYDMFLLFNCRGNNGMIFQFVRCTGVTIDPL